MTYGPIFMPLPLLQVELVIVVVMQQQQQQQQVAAAKRGITHPLTGLADKDLGVLYCMCLVVAKNYRLPSRTGRRWCSQLQTIVEKLMVNSSQERHADSG
jgi:hypothetical protein